MLGRLGLHATVRHGGAEPCKRFPSGPNDDDVLLRPANMVKDTELKRRRRRIVVDCLGERRCWFCFVDLSAGRTVPGLV